MSRYRSRTTKSTGVLWLLVAGAQAAVIGSTVVGMVVLCSALVGTAVLGLHLRAATASGERVTAP
ncbi:MAG TPA: hypothetical protein VK453_27930 [Micromonosporaceae bacterium]|nr:hypothetical protein [Micromonosporaceae bacterium]